MMIRKSRKTVGPMRNSNTGGKWQYAWYVAVPLVLLLTMTAPWQRMVGNFFAPYLKIANFAGNGLADQTVKLHSRKQLAREVARLTEQNLKLAMQLKTAEQQADESRHLRAMLKLENPPGFDYIACNVLLRDPWMWNSGFTIDRGSRDGLQEGLAVVAPAIDRGDRVILLGVIESVNKYTSRVMSVLNPEFRISVALPESGAVGFLNAGAFERSSGGTASVGFLPANRTFALNELMFTTGFEAAIPGGLWLGSLESIEPASLPFGNRLYRRGVMRPAGEFEHLRTVMVARLSSRLPQKVQE